MKKIIAGILGTLAVAAVVGGAAWALFISSATMTDVSFAAGNADLRIWDLSTYASTWNSGVNLTNMYPGYEAPPVDMWLKNESDASIALNLTMGLTSGGANWGNGMENAVEAYVATADDSDWTSWKTLSDWNTNPALLPGGSLAQGAERMYKIYFRLNPGSGNEVADLSLPGVAFTLTGEQEL